MNKIISGILIFLALVAVIAGGGIFAYYNLLKVEKYIIQEDIKDSKFIVSEMDIEGGCKMEGKFCFAYFGHYKYKFKDKKNDIPIDVTVEQHFNKVTEENVFYTLRDKFLVDQLAKGNWIRSYFLGGTDNYGRTVIGGSSGTMLITIRTGTEEADYLEDFLTEYFKKYPSNIK